MDIEFLLGDFNLYYAVWDRRPPGDRAAPKAKELLEFICSNDWWLLDQPGKFTRKRKNVRSGVIDRFLKDIQTVLDSAVRKYVTIVDPHIEKARRANILLLSQSRYHLYGWWPHRGMHYITVN